MTALCRVKAVISQICGSGKKPEKRSAMIFYNRTPVLGLGFRTGVFSGLGVYFFVPGRVFSVANREASAARTESVRVWCAGLWIVNGFESGNYWVHRAVIGYYLSFPHLPLSHLLFIFAENLKRLFYRRPRFALPFFLSCFKCPFVLKHRFWGQIERFVAVWGFPNSFSFWTKRQFFSVICPNWPLFWTKWLSFDRVLSKLPIILDKVFDF